MKKSFCVCIISFLFLSSVAQKFTDFGPTDLNYVNDILIGKDNKIFIGTNGGLYESTDMGATWKRPTNFKGSVYQTPQFKVNDKTGDIYWYGSSSGAEFYHSTDNGANWINHYLFIPEQISALDVYGDSIFIGTNKGMYVNRISENAIIPTAIASFANMEITHIEFYQNMVAVATANNGIYTSTDRGVTWRNKSNLSTGRALCLGIANNTIFISYGLNGVYASADGGATWVSKNAGLTRNYVIDMYVGENKLYAITDGSDFVYYTTPDATTAWMRMTTSPQPNYVATAIAVKGNFSVVGSWYQLHRSTDSGASWTESHEGIRDAFQFRTMLVDSKETIWAIASNTGIYRKRKTENFFQKFDTPGYAETVLQGDTLILATDHIVRKYNVITEQWGKSIVALNIFMNDCVHTEQYLFLGTMNQGIYRYSKNGSWNNFNTGLPGLEIKDFKNKGNTLYAATTQGLYKTDAGADAWTKLSISTANVGVHMLGISNSIIVAAADNDTYISRDDGNSWEVIGQLKNNYLNSIHIKGDTIYAGTANMLFVSLNAGNAWQKQPINYFVDAVLEHDGTVYVGTLENGIKGITFNQSQTINFSLTDKTQGDEPFPLKASATSGLPVSYVSSNNTVLTINDAGVATILKAGTVKVKASQSGNLFFKAAADVELSITITPVVGIEDEYDLSSRYSLYPNPGRGDYSIEIPDNADITRYRVSIIDALGREIQPNVYYEEKNVIRIQTKNLSTGQFTMLINAGKKVVVKRFNNVN